MLIPNADQHSQDYEAIRYTPRPGHGDYAGFVTTITLDVPYLCKYWDENAESTGKSGANIPVYRYADVLLMCAALHLRKSC